MKTQESKNKDENKLNRNCRTLVKELRLISPCDKEYTNKEIINQFDSTNQLFFLTNISKDKTDHSHNIIGKCLCGQEGLSGHYIIINKKTKKRCWVGSQCIDKFMEHIKQRRKRIERLTKHKQKGYTVCFRCEKKLPSETVTKLEIYGRPKTLMSHNTCWKRWLGPEYIVKFGKYRGKTFEEILKNDRKYCCWVLDTDRDKIKSLYMLYFYDWLYKQGLIEIEKERISDIKNKT